MTKVSLVKCQTYDYNKVKAAVNKSITLAGSLKKTIKKSDTVLLKVNLLKAAKPKQAITTHPAIVKAVCEQILDLGATPIVGDTQNTQMDKGRSSLEISGIKAVCDELKVKAIDFKDNGFTKVKVPKPVQMKEIWLAKDILDADTIISLPKMKTHMLTSYTGAVKNFFGCIPFGERMKAHVLGKDDLFAEVLSDIYSVIKPQYSIMDGIIGMEGDGPTHGPKRNYNLIASSPDCVSLDAVCSNLMGFSSINTVTAAEKRGLGTAGLSKIQILGDKIAPFKIKMPNQNMRKSQNLASLLPKSIRDYIAKTLLKFEPRVDESKCKKCAICEKACPVHAITMNPYPEFDRDKCIKCFCCHELCPEGAIYTHKSWLAKHWR